MTEDNLVAGIILGVALSWFYNWWNEPTAISNTKEQFEGAVVLDKLMSGQVAIIHGFVDDYSVCEIIRARLERDGGIYGCGPADGAQKPPQP